MTEKQNVYPYTDKTTGKFMGNYVRNLKNIEFEPTFGLSIQLAVETAIKLSQSYQLPVVLSYNDDEINIPLDKNISADSIVKAYRAKYQNTK